ncbi:MULTISPECIES: 3-phenylpropionate/cinnamic acid dioxygenase subunit beta [unclassified Burkholderia]|uniref:3-phenylpropionate/cinnamic acid dioxygenase subunit beta n=1 Tax=unclassified Burkholderia TaxID=2613784 RepID=UPI000F55EEF0|nr:MULTISPECIES: 3-phenylpropionate/cinnamic acid dioxygenase subunit beta [unclassified Burkholderia]RQR68768.1 3-phenylpropionate dioxygenase [Burkholderia sp. Bp9012]RQR70275.1 3-phenylpropionate dioxygenase [Burkholderia sp. Bp9011]RQR83021.1 3-phenylpropionate dioxygenase [Burkholderia sp. Bp9010]RQZ39430.1 3-phenylpropionate dioxygenase [Burkholderia sp. Bp9099]
MNAHAIADFALPAGPAADRETTHRIEQFLFHEARLLDCERWEEWLALMTPDIHYWMPSIENRRRADKLGAYARGRGAYFDDTHLDLERRVARFMQPSAWAEDPPTRHVHVISNVEASHAQSAGEYIVQSVFANYRSRGEADNDLLFGRREDTLREVEGELRIAQRTIVITQSLLMSKNLNTFF